MTGTRTSISLKPFDRNNEFIVKRELKIQGQVFRNGDPLDKSSLTTRRLRQLYELRSIVAAPPDPNKKPDFLKMPTKDILAWLKVRGVIPRYGALRASIITQASKFWDQEHKMESV